MLCYAYTVWMSSSDNACMWSLFVGSIRLQTFLLTKCGWCMVVKTGVSVLLDPHTKCAGVPEPYVEDEWLVAL